MPRPRGAPNADHDAKRAALLDRLLTALTESREPPSLRGLAAAAGVSTPTLRHYFGDRDAVLAAVFAHCRRRAAGELRTAATPAGPVAASVHGLLEHAAAGFAHAGLGRLHELGLREGLTGPAAAAAYLSDVLDPTLDAFAARLAAHVAAGELRPLDPRRAAVQLLAPLLVAHLHQRGLGGADGRPLDLPALIAETADTFVRGNRPA